MSELNPNQIIGKEQFVEGVDDDDSKVSAPEKKKKKKKRSEPKLPEDLKPFEKEAAIFAKSNRRILADLAGDNTLRFKPGKGFKINLVSGEVTLGLEQWKWAHEHGLGHEQILFSSGHEIAHFWDLREDPEGMLENFDYMEKKARGLAPQVEAILKKKHGDLPEYLTKQKKVDPDDPSKTMSGLEIFLYKQLHTLYNCLDDIYVNKRVGRKMARYLIEGKRHSPQVMKMYRDFLFPTDSKKRGQPPEDELTSYYLKKSAKAQQLVYLLLRKRMVPDQMVIVDDEIKKIVEDEDMEKLVDFITTPSPDGIPEKDQHRASWRYKQIKEYIEPFYIELLMKDIEELEIPPEKETQMGDGEGEGEEGEGEGEPKDGEPKDGKPNPWSQLNPNKPMDRKTVADYLKDKKGKDEEESKKVAERERKARMTPAERAKEAIRRADKAFAEKHDIPEEKVHDYRQISHEIAKHKEELAQLFESICKNISRQIELAWEKYYRSGKLDVARLTKKYGPYFVDKKMLSFVQFDQLETYQQRAFIEKLSLKPDEFRIRFIVDCSGSMTLGDKTYKAKEVLVLFLESLATFEDKIDRMFKKFNMKQPPLRARTQIITFGDEGGSEEVKKLRTERRINVEQERVDRLRGFAGIHSDGGNTCDDEAWQKVKGTFWDGDSEKIKKGELKDIAIEITDGGSTTAAETRSLLHQISNMGIVTRAIGVFDKDEEGDDYRSSWRSSDLDTFDEVWGKDGEVIHDVSELVEAVYKLLKEQIQDINFQMGEAEE
ncbi:VWA domain-containing protein [Candidatus Falkowbacteria bacterium]|nr:VWA domain-containing protein [Candidatus Falkowbacteria bacterium]